MVEVEKNFTAVERLLYYENVLKGDDDKIGDNKETKLIKSEAEPINYDYRAPNNWPNNGELVMNNLSMKYRDDLDYVLKNINIKINSGEKIGIVGRTGAGKSSLLMCLFRLVEPCINSSLYIDNIDCLKLGLKELRSKISIIPQDPVLFSGTIKFNLDPFNINNDYDIINILKKCQLYDKLKGGCNSDNDLDILNYHVTENGDNFSNGQKQLICIARAFLQNNKILVLDEATASIDQKTDKLIQELIRNDFKNKTVICIAHRLQTIIDYDRLIVLQNGIIKQFDKPNILLKNKNGLFYQMYNDANKH